MAIPIITVASFLSTLNFNVRISDTASNISASLNSLQTNLANIFSITISDK